MRQSGTMNGIRQLIYVSAGVEAVTGIAALADPSLVVWLLFAVPLTIGGELVGRLAGCALISLALACWPMGRTRGGSAAFRGLLSYNGLAATLLLIIAVGSRFVGILLWLAVVFHGVLTILLFLARRSKKPAAF